MVNADDFGLTESVNNGIIKSYRQGIVTSASIMPTGKAFNHAVKLAQENADLSIGVHLSLTQEQSVLAVSDILTLVDNQQFFCRNWQIFMLKYFTGKIHISDIEKELDAQIQKVVLTGLNPAFLDSHQHIHLIPSVWKTVVCLSQKYKIMHIRYPKEPFFAKSSSTKAFFKKLCIRLFLSFLEKERNENCRGIKFTDHFIGLSASGRLTERLLANYIKKLNSGVTELMCHPGDFSSSGEYKHWGYQWAEELSALTSSRIKNLLSASNVKLISSRGDI